MRQFELFGVHGRLSAIERELELLRGGGPVAHIAGREARSRAYALRRERGELRELLRRHREESQ